ncbi:hypothetical protein RHOFW104T7_03430 [Rhodanobacter thiooxydans]|uniref:DUF924 domain-containing protein n=1 Tax=Rhodanobacter thiooxydans TaxID=416169 RepID=A0A154QCE8_9GAMM|nr:DUF924 family protein [Rhodanobacter thiooxydans]EIL97684.1 hypothetical protein UUA_14224 [Rhodanobacter thiooxydans LCS2]KZC21908.1 hypothetical protein RHOFW104T7_03430 [Rhodanobacter thiooxydans]MCW0203941.1 DUF924 domain-containing protein [Rhodanobacter thiooxydans]
MPTTAQDVLDFWFAEANAARWFVVDDTFDAQIRERFGAAAQGAAEGRLDDWAHTPPGWLALLILLDQFPRNLYRNDPRAWAADAGAQRMALSGLARGDDRQLPAVQRVFAYLPLEHAEDLALQRRSVALFEALAAEAEAEQRPLFDDYVDYARRHHQVIARFGRFPHRNAVLGRPSTPEELHYLAQPGAGF